MRSGDAVPLQSAVLDRRAVPVSRVERAVLEQLRVLNARRLADPEVARSPFAALVLRPVEDVDEVALGAGRWGLQCAVVPVDADRIVRHGFAAHPGRAEFEIAGAEAAQQPVVNLHVEQRASVDAGVVARLLQELTRFDELAAEPVDYGVLASVLGAPHWTGWPE